MSWTTQQVLSFAPDAATAKRGKALASERNWRLLGGNQRVIWGECKSSSLSYYRTQVDLSGPAFKCNCPSRKFPCKHAIGLLLIFISRSEAFFINDEGPDWVEAWMTTRKGKTSSSKDPEEVAQMQQKNLEQRKKNRTKRLNRMTQGVNDLETWLLDLIRQGLASTEQLDYNYWQDIAARMVDNKLGGVGMKIRALPLLQGGNTEWPAQMLSELTELFLLARGLKNLEQLPEPLQDQLLSVAGVNVKKDELLQAEGVTDQWTVLGQFTGVNIDNGTYRRTWLEGAKTQRKALLLEYDYRDSGFPFDWPIGKTFKSKLVYYPGSYPLRAVVDTPEFTAPENPQFKGHKHLASFFEAYANALAANPWLIDFPACLQSVTPVYTNHQLHVVDENNQSIPLISRENVPWKLLAISGGRAITIFGEWTGKKLLPLSTFKDGRWIAL